MFYRNKKQTEIEYTGRHRAPDDLIPRHQAEDSMEDVFVTDELPPFEPTSPIQTQYQ